MVSGLLKHRSAAISAAALLAAAAVVLFWTIASPASGGTYADGASAGEAQAAGYAADRRPVYRLDEPFWDGESMCIEGATDALESSSSTSSTFWLLG